MKLPIVSRKKYEMAKNNFKMLMEAKMELQKNYVECQKERNELLDANRTLVSNQSCLQYTNEELKKENIKLTALCIKYGIVIKKERKKCTQTAKE